MKFEYPQDHYNYEPSSFISIPLNINNYITNCFLIFLNDFIIEFYLDILPWIFSDFWL